MPKLARTIFTCKVCGKTLEMTPGRAAKRLYCSRKCNGTAKQIQYKGKTTHFHILDEHKEVEICRLYVDEKMPAYKIAPLYGVTTATIQRVTKKHNIRRTPSEAARLRAIQHPEIIENARLKKIGKFTGDKSPRYKNGSGKWPQCIIERDDFTCHDCHVRDPEIVEAHHIIPRSRSKELEFDMSNAITLCPNCHKRRHVRDGTWTQSRK